MLQDISPKKLDNHYSCDIKPDSDSIIFCFHGSEVVADENSDSIFPVFSDFGEPFETVYLFSVGKAKYFLAYGETPVPDGFSLIDIKKLRYSEKVEQESVFELFTAYHLSQWYNSSRFCGVCGMTTELYRKERAVRCTGCGKIIYPRLNPAVIVGVTNGDKLLITRYAENRGVSYDALVAGFTEIGETLEETVSREVMEEVGLKVKNIRYYKSQPWGFSGGILAGFYCDVEGNDEIRLDRSELSSAVWTERQNINGQPDDYSLTNEMMMSFRKHNV